MMLRLFVILLIVLCAGSIVRAEDKLVPLNIARGKPAKASATQEGHAPADPLDGDLGTRWCAPDNNAGYWWQVDLQKPSDFSSCRIVWEHDGVPYQYKLEGSADEKTWSMLADATKAKTASQVREHKFDAKGVRFIRMTITGVVDGHWASFLEFELFGNETIAASKQTTKSSVDGNGQVASNLPVSGEGLLREVKLAPEFSASIFAAPPDVSYPTCIAAAPNGELFVGIDENGSLDQKPGRGRIVRCIDTDGDGKADKFNIFADNVDSPRGLQWDGAGTLYVLHPPLLEALHDDNGDGTADRREVIVKGIGPDLNFRGADHTINGIRQGIDGWIYVACGDYGFTKAVTNKGVELQLYGGGVVRVRPDGSDIEDVSRGQRNVYDVAISPLMDLFTRDNTNDGGGWDVRLSHVIQTGNYGYPSLFKNFGDEIIQPLFDYGGGSPCGSLFIDEPGFPEGYGNTLYTCEWGRSAVNRHPLTANGASFKVEQQPLVELPRPTDMDVDGQGKMYVASWRNGGFNYGGPNVGYILQIVPKDAKPVSFPDLKKATDDDLLKHLASPSGTCRFFTQQEILRRGEKPSFAAGLLKLASADGPIAPRVAAIFTLAQLQHAKSHDSLLKLGADPKVREFALRAAADQRLDAKDLPAKPYLDALVDADPRVRLQAAVALGRLNRTEAGPALVKLTADADPIVSHVAVQAAVAVKAIEPCFKAIDDAQTASVPGAIRVLQLIHEPAVVDGLISRLTVKEPAIRLPILKALCRLHYREANWPGDWWGTRPDTSGPYFRTAAGSETPKIAAALKDAIASADDQTARVLLVEIKKNKLDLGNSTQMLLKLAAGDEKFAESAVDLIAAKNDVPPDVLPLVERMAVSVKQPPARRAAALRAIARAAAAKSENLESAMRAFAAIGAEEKVADDVARAREEFIRDGSRVRDLPSFIKLAGNETPALRQLAYSVLLTIEQKPDAPKEARDAAARTVDAGWSDPKAAAVLLRAIGQSRAEAYAHQVRSHQNDTNPATKSAAAYAAAELRLDAPGVGKRMTVAQMPYEQAVNEAVKAKGDAKVGAQLFIRQGCVACHTTHPNDPPKGPFLGDAAAKYSRHELLESILHPSAKIAQGFVTNYFITNDNKRTDGFIVREAGDEIEVRNIAGVSTIIPRSKLKRRGELKDSVMPTGLADPLTTEELASILAYLESLKAK